MQQRMPTICCARRLLTSWSLGPVFVPVNGPRGWRPVLETCSSRALESYYGWRPWPLQRDHTWKIAFGPHDGNPATFSRYVLHAASNTCQVATELASTCLQGAGSRRVHAARVVCLETKSKIVSHT